MTQIDHCKNEACHNGRLAIKADIPWTGSIRWEDCPNPIHWETIHVEGESMTRRRNDISDPIRIGDDVVVGEQLDPKDDLLYKGYFGRVIGRMDDYALVDSDAVGLFQSVSFKAWLPIRTLTRTA